MDARHIEVETSGGRVPAYEARPEATAGGRGAVLVLSEIYGLNEYLQDVTRRLAGEGYHAVAPDLFHRQGGGAIPYDAGPEIGERLAGLRDDDILADCDAALAHLFAAGWAPASAGVVGFRLGGRLSFLLASERALGAAVGFYGGGLVQRRVPQLAPLVDRAPSLKTPWLGLYGDADVWTSVADLERLRLELARSAGPRHDVVVYAGVGHGFHCDRDPGAYDLETARRAWARALEWLDAHLNHREEASVR